MPEEIRNKLHAALYHISPLASDRDRLIEQIGQTVWIESLEKVMSALPEDARAKAIQLLNDNNLDEAVSLMEGSGIDLDAIVTEVSTSVMNEVLEVVG